MSRVLYFATGVAGCIAGGVLFLVFGSDGLSSRDKPGALETVLARWVRAAAIPSEARSRKNPLGAGAEMEMDARAHWADHCASCHANDGSGDTPMGKNTYPPAPDMRLAATQGMTDGELFYAIQNGIRFTAMPAWGNGSAKDAEDSWKLVRFIRHLPKMTATEKEAMKTMNPRTPDEFREEQEEEKFLKGEDANEIKHL